jgi:hypothetical protein
MTTTTKLWWQKPLRVIQPNLQIKDTMQIDPERLAAQMEEMGANTMVFNVGGIYAWYASQVPYHHVNEYLPTEFDLLQSVIDACHRRNIRFVARFDFSKAEDRIYLQKPQWFVRKADREPEIIGLKRPGEWSLLMSTCANSDYRNEAVAIPVLAEVLDRYDIDGIFFNNPQYALCECETCRQKYKRTYGKDLPASPDQYEPDWKSICMRDNMDRMYRFIKGKKPDVPMILYYNLYHDNLFDREKTADMLCTESQDILSLGHGNIPEFWRPALGMKLGRSLPERPAPFGIVHSCPGMDWRHTGLPPAEFQFWLAQIPANGGNIWHSITGVPDTITDKRILRIVSEVNRGILKTESHMEDARAYSQVALLWNAAKSAEGWADGLINNQIPFDMLLIEQATIENLISYKAIIVPESFKLTEELVTQLTAYVQQGGSLIVEGRLPLESLDLLPLLGIAPDYDISENLEASYLRFEGERNLLQRGMEDTELIPHRGQVVYCQPAGPDTIVLATLVPPFSPMDSVGAPPERASMLVDRTDLPLALLHQYGQGKVLYFPFKLSQLINEYRLGEHYQLLANGIDLALGGERFIHVTPYSGLQVTVFRKEQEILVHLVNGAGRRPLSTTLPLHNIEVILRIPHEKVEEVSQLISKDPLTFDGLYSSIRFTIPVLKVWECISIRLQ